MKKGALCTLSMTLLLIGGLNWGLTALGYFISSNLNVVNLLLGKWPVVENIIYLLVGLAAIKVIVFMLMGRDCCMSCSTDKKEMM